MKFKEITYCGHSAVLVRADGGYTIGIDPWLQGNPKCPASLQNPERLDLIVLTHGHVDHTGDVLRLMKAYPSKLVATYELAMILIQEGVPQERVVPMNKGGCTTIEGIVVSMVNAFHSSSYDSPTRGTLYAGEAAGFVLRDGTHSLYHAGDTALFSDMKLIKDLFAPTVAFLPIGDTYTMGPGHASIAASWIGAPRVVPIHYGTFPGLVQNADTFSQRCKEGGIECIALEPGKSLLLE